MLADAVLIYEEFDFSGLVKAGIHSLRRDGYVVGCSNSLCRNGGYDLRPQIDKMMSPKAEQSKFVCLQCEGREAKPKPSNVNTCTGSIEGTLQLKVRKKAR